MKRHQSSRASSPTPTTFSGISNYRTESYRPIKDQGHVPALPSPDPRVIARTHYTELQQYLVAYLSKAPANSRSTARQKLTRLTKQQFQELSTDVYDELVRRKLNTPEDEIPCLPARDEFHPKRNQARQKLATLPTARFEDLSSDVYFELSRRYPEFKEEIEDRTGPIDSPGSAYDDVPSPEFHTSPRSDAPNLPSGSRLGRTSEDIVVMDSGYGSSSLGRRPSEDGFGRQRQSDDEVPHTSGRRSEDIYGGEANGYGFGARRRPSQDIIRAGAGADFGRRPSASASIHSDSTGTTNGQSATATSGMIIPNKSTIAEEDIEVPYGREEVRDSSGTAVDDRGREGDGDGFGGTEGEHEHESAPMGGLSGLSARLRSQVMGDVMDDDDGGGARSGDDYFDKVSLGRASVTSDRSAAGASRMLGGRASGLGDEHERLRREYEFKIATMQSRIVTLERDHGNTEQREQELRESQQRIKLLEGEIDGFRRRAEEHGSAMRTLHKELDELRELRAREKEREIKRAQHDEEELQILRDRCESLEEERESGPGMGDHEMMEQLRSDMEGLMAELTDLGRRNDELMTAKDADLVIIRDLDNQSKEYKRKYEQAKNELRSVKATSQLFSQAPKMDDQLPVAPDGGLVDIHLTAFVSGIDSLLTAGRSNAPTRVLMPMKAVVNSASAVIEDVRAYESRPTRVDVDIDHLRSLRERLEVTLSNLVAATKTHATSSGMSPVSLLDAAASHVSATITEISRFIFIRKATRAEQEDFLTSPLPSQSAPSYAPSLRSVDELRSGHERKSSGGSLRRGDGESPMGAAGRFGDRRGASSAEPSSSNTNSPPPIFDKSPVPGGSGGISDDSAPPEDAWSELKTYLEAQTESIVYAIQSVLSGVRSPIPAPTLNENLTQIITIVSSIVAVCSDNLPPVSAQQGADILAQLSEHARKLQDVQALPEVTKESRQIMAKSSFAVANAMKGLMKL
ncbi:hypothetical protein PAXRUDRAFT_833539 [Paxillus rubicundulus Ve08.2h10]|uniref:GIT Spa2 homology (SHD) domain-containing protein n=1 Tax=Paxillus rubicundulus Ve08.2h10 TaxID=930991 RepID=A0A0D0D9I6_9AGAM|nr:hypothetical protein PAXRUDRAFT_833539 [Paxillus rubicundulus Ve08.2h10]